MLGYHVTGSTGTVFLYGLVFGAVAMLGLALVLGGARRSSRRGIAARRSLRQSRRETTAVSQDRDDLIGQRDEAARGPGQESRRRIGVGRAGAVPGGRRASRRTGRVARLRPPTRAGRPRPGAFTRLAEKPPPGTRIPRRRPRKMVQLCISLRTWQVRPCISGGPAGPDFLVHGTVLPGTAATDGESPGEFPVAICPA
jgi:hypothetical protein